MAKIDNQPIYYKNRLVDKKVPGTFFVPGTFLSLPLKRQCQAPYIGLICLRWCQALPLQYQLRFHKSFCGIKQNLSASWQILLDGIGNYIRLYIVPYHPLPTKWGEGKGEGEKDMPPPPLILIFSPFWGGEEIYLCFKVSHPKGEILLDGIGNYINPFNLENVV